MKPTQYEFEKISNDHIRINTFTLKVVGDGQTGRTGIVVMCVPPVEIEAGTDNSLGYLSPDETRQMNKLKMKAHKENMRDDGNKNRITHRECVSKQKVSYARHPKKPSIIKQPRPGF